MGSVDPLDGHLLLGVGHIGQGQQLGLADVLAVLIAALEAHHLVGDTIDGVLHSGHAAHDGLLDIGLGRQVGTAPLEEGELDAPDLGAGLLLDYLGQQGGQAAQLGVAEAVGGRGLGLGDEGAVGVVDALGDGHHAVALLLVDALHVGQELIHVEVHLGQVHQIGAGAVGGGQGGGASQPAGVAAHDLDDADHAGVIHSGILIDLHAAGGNILGGGGEAGAVVGSKQVVVDGLGHAHHAALIADLLHVLADLVAGVHRVVAAVVEEVADVILLEDLQNPLVVGVIHIRVRHLVPAGAQGRGGGVLQQFQLCRVLLAHIKQPVVQNALDAVLRAQDAGDAGVLQCRGDDAVGTSVDDGSRAAGLAENAGAFQFTHGKILLRFGFGMLSFIISFKKRIVNTCILKIL